jgi:membrane protease YdiL (CAAX protease family)
MVIFASTNALMKSLREPWSLIASCFTAAILTFGLTVVFIRWQKLQLNEVGFVLNKRSFSRVLIGFMLGLLLPGLQAALVLLTGHVKLVVSTRVTLTTIFSTLLLYVMLSCREEFAYRAYSQHSLKYRSGPWIALLMGALLFGIEHVLGGASWLYGLAGAGVGSLLYGMAALTTRELAFPIGIHAAWNVGQWALGFKDNSGIFSAVIDKEYKDHVDKIGFISYLAVMGLGIAAIYFYQKRSERAKMKKGPL